MAVLTEHPRVRARVKCERKTLQEYDADDADEEDTPSTNAITKYIEAKSGAEFVVELELQRPFPIHPILITLFLDGKYVTSRMASNTQYKRAHGTLKRSFDSIATRIARGQCLEQNFCFSEPQIGMTSSLGYPLLLTCLDDSDD